MSDFIDLPATSDQAKTIPIGIHRMTITKMEKAVDKNNQPILDNRNYPAIRIVFATQKDMTIDSLFHFSPKPQNDPTRNDPAVMCRSEFRLNNLKRALGFGQEPVKADLIKGKFFFGMIYGEMWVHEENPKQAVLRDPNDPESKIIFSRLGSIFWPDNTTRPVKDGDPQNPASNGKPSGEFLKTKTVKKAEIDKFLEKSDKKSSAAAPAAKEYKDDFGGEKPQAPEEPQQAAADDLPEKTSETADW